MRADYILVFQAEDGIRDGHVTGVQTLLFRSALSRPAAVPSRRFRQCARIWSRSASPRKPLRCSAPVSPSNWKKKIGRASCRERGKISGVEASGREEKKHVDYGTTCRGKGR